MPVAPNPSSAPARVRAVAGPLVGCLLGCLLLAACGQGGKPPAADAETNAGVPVEVAAAARRSIEASYSGTATLEADSEAQVAAKISGVLVKLLVQEGDHVKAGQELARLDDEMPRLNLTKAEATLHKLENDFRRSNELFERKLVSPEQNDKIRYDLATQRAAWELARLELSYTNVVAPISGVVSRRLVKEGNYVALNQALLQIDNFDPLLAVLNVPERQLGTLHAGQAVGMRVDAVAGERFEGRIQRISPVVDAATGTFRVTCEFRDAGGRLKSGMFGRLDITYDRHDDALAIPRAALIEEDGETAVFVVVSGAQAAAAADADQTPAKTGTDPAAKPKAPPEWVAQRRLVRIGYGDAGYVEIVDGLGEGDRVVTVGRTAVRDGTALQLLEAVR